MKAGGLTSIIAGAVVTLAMKASGYIWPQIMIPAGDPNGDPFGIPLVFWALPASLLGLFVVTYLTKPPDKESLARLFPDKKAE